MKKLVQDIKYLGYVLVHPFDGFYETKNRGRGNFAIAHTLLILYGILGIFKTQYTGYIFNSYPTFALESISLFMTAVLPVLLFVISNFSTTSLMNGNGRLRDIYLSTCYSLVPLLLFQSIAVLLSNIIIIEEGPILSAFESIGTVWFCFLIFSAMCTIHEYSAMKNIVTLLVTLVAAIIIMFLCVLYFTLMDTVINFVNTVITELSKKW